ncbi:MAG: (Fe-S)-binding protein [Fimbriimonas ginsengisoli]|nr:(Fe-S)-binding protein [Fimbriimonas ginsengisoli]
MTRQEFLFLSNPEKFLFYALAFASLGIAAWQIAGRARLWLSGKPISWGGPQRAGWLRWLPATSALRWWWGNVWSYVLLQRKVRSSRKRSGAPMHLMIFYGFLTLFIGTTLLAINTYSPVKFHRGLYYLLYEQALDWMGVVFVVGVVWAFFRRHSMSRAELGRAALSPEIDEALRAKQSVDGRRRPMSHALSDNLALGLLLVLGLTGFLLEGARISANPHWFDATTSPVGFSVSSLIGRVSPDGYRVIWWFHAFWVFVFFSVFPRMRLRHLVMAVLSTAGRPPASMGELAPISLAEVEQTGQIGVAVARDYSRWHLMSLDACMECGRCTEVCPAWAVGKVLNPKQVVQDLRGAMASGEAVASAVSEEALWACTTCNACVEACPVLIRHVDLIVDVRRNLVAEGKLSGPSAVMLRQTASTGNAWGAPAANREDWMKGLDIPLCRDGVEFDWLLWVGCAGATDPGAVKTTKAVAALLKKAGVKFACLGPEEACTGDPARRVGDEFLFQDKAQQNVSVFERYAVRRVVTPCPHCFNTLKNEYGAFGGRFEEVIHHSQMLARLIAEGRLQAAAPKAAQVVFHDPCYLARVNNESDAPRFALGELTELNDALIPERPSRSRLAEPPHLGRKTLCCGAGGGRMWMEEPPTHRPANRRVDELLATGAQTVAVACPFCRIMLDAGIKQARPDDDVRLVDLAELLAERNA